MPRRDIDAPLIAALAGGATATVAADRVGASLRTVLRRLDDPAFTELLDQAKAATVQGALDRLNAASGAAVETLLRLLKEDQPPGARLGAARAILELAARYRSELDLEQRIAALERAQGEKP